jgi:hypothetical protein
MSCNICYIIIKRGFFFSFLLMMKTETGVLHVTDCFVY